MKTTIPALICCLFITLHLSAEERIPADENDDGVPDTWTIFDDGVRTGVLYDSDFDGEVDFSLHYNRDSQLIEQRQDFNRDGEMDDYYFFSNDVMVRREVDTNYDTAIDIWVYLDQGIYITHYEQDTDFDGEVDKVKEFGPQ